MAQAAAAPAEESDEDVGITSQAAPAQQTQPPPAQGEEGRQITVRPRAQPKAEESDADVGIKAPGSGSGSVGQAVGTGVLGGIPYARQLAAAGVAGIGAISRALPNSWLNADQRKAISGLPEGYDQANERALQADKEAEAAHPFIKAGTSLATGAALLPLGGATKGVASGISSMVPRAAPIVSRIGGATLVGGGVGGAYGASSGEGLFDPSAAEWGTVLGAGGGALAEPIAAGLGKVARGAGQWLGLSNPEAEAASKISGAYQADQRAGNAAMTPAQFAAAKAAGQPVMAGDLGGEAVRRLARTATNVSPEAGAALAQPLGDRFQGQSGRVSDFIDGLFPGKDLNTTIERDRIATEARSVNSPAYTTAFNDPNAGAVWSPNLSNLMRSPDVQDAISLAQKKGANYAVLNNQPIPQTPFVKDATGNWSLRTDAQGNAVGIPSLQFWDQVKRGLDSKIGIAKRAGDNDSARELTGLNESLKSELDQQVPQYAQARAGAAKFFGQENAVDGAEAFHKATSEGAINQAKAKLQSMAPADREVFARAYAANLQQKAANVADNSDLARQFSNDTLRSKMAAALNTPSDPLRAAKMEAFIERENMMNMLKNKVLGNSTTVQQAKDAEHGGHGLTGMIASQFGAPVSGAITGGALGWEQTHEGASFMERAKNVGVGALLGGIMGVVTKGRATANEETMRIIGQQLASNDPAIYQRALNHVARTPWLQKAVRNLSMVASGQFGAKYGQ